MVPMVRLPSQPSTLQIPQKVASTLPCSPGDFDLDQSIAFQDRIVRNGQPVALRLERTLSELPEVTPIELRPEGLGPPIPRVLSASQISLHSHLPYEGFDTDMEDILPVQTRIPRVRIEPRERPVERIPRDLIPIPPSSVMRCSRNIRIRSSRSRYTIQPGTKKFSDAALCPPGWEASTHPEGALYFFNAERRIFTDANLYKYKNVDIIARCADSVFDMAKAQEIDLTEDMELVLEIMDERRSRLRRCGYYFVDPSNRSIFWVHPFQAEAIFENVKGAKSPGHIKYAIESQYWMHCELFPHNRTIEESLVFEVKEIILHATSETITSDTSLAPFGSDDMSKMLDVVGHLEGSVNRIHAHSICVLARFMCTFSRTRFFNFYGQVGARLAADQSVYSKNRRQISILLTIVSPLLFGAPHIHAQGLNAICIDQLVNHVSWKPFINKLNSEWEAFALYSTIVLNANIAFLAVPNLTSAARISNYVSTVSNIGAITLGLLLVHQNRSHAGDSAEGAVTFVTRMSHSMFGTEALAIIYSMPYALLMWGMIFFGLGFAFLVFQYSDRITRILVGFALGLVAFFVIWTVWAAWDSRVILWLRSTSRKAKRAFWHRATRNRLFARILRQRFPPEEEGELMMPPGNVSETVATDSDLED